MAGISGVAGGSENQELRQQVEFLKAENQILRSKLPARVVVTPQEKARLVKLGRGLGAAVQHLLSIVSYRTFLRWLQGEKKPAREKAEPKQGRPKTSEEIEELVVRLARENGWGYTRVLGELMKLGISNISRSTVVNILKRNDLDTGPKRGEGTWADFLQRHAATLWACDFFSTKVWTVGGLREYFVLFFIHLGTRRVHIAGMTTNPDKVWMVQQARNLAMFFDDLPEKPQFLIRDLDGKFVPEFDAILESQEIEIVTVGPQAPNVNSVAERWVLSIKSECLDHFVIFGEEHLRYLVCEYIRFYNEMRPHQGLTNDPLLPFAGPTEPKTVSVEGEVLCDARLGGLLKHYYRRAA